MRSGAGLTDQIHNHSGIRATDGTECVRWRAECVRRPASGGCPSPEPVLTGKGRLQGLSHGGTGGKSGKPFTASGTDHRFESELDRFRNPPFGVTDLAEVPGQPQFTEAGQRPAMPAGQGFAPLGRSHRQGHGEIGSRFIDPDPADHIDENVGAAETEPGVAGKDRQDHAEAVTVDAVDDPPRDLQFAR